MALPSITQKRVAIDSFNRLTPRSPDKDRRLRALRDLRRRPRPAGVLSTLQRPANYLRHDTDQLGKAIPELRLVIKHAGIDAKSHPRHRFQSESEINRGQQVLPAPSSTEDKGTTTCESTSGNGRYLEVDWKESGEEHERPCYWSLLEKLNWELQVKDE